MISVSFHEKASVCQARRRGGATAGVVISADVSTSSALLPFALWSTAQCRVQEGVCLESEGALQSLWRSQFEPGSEDTSQSPDLGTSSKRSIRSPLVAFSLADAFAFRLFVRDQFCYAATARSALNSGTYVSPVIQRWCIRTASLRATATTARFFAFLPPRSAMAKP